MSLENYLDKSLKLNKNRLQHSLKIGLDGEALFKEITSAIKSEAAEDKKHIDFHWEGKKVDVKGLKKTQKLGYLLIEMINVYGGAGWCSKDSQAEYIAFQFPERILDLNKNVLRNKVINLCEKYTEPLRKNRIPIEEGLYKWIGRYNRQDVFTYIKLSDVIDIVDYEIKY